MSATMREKGLLFLQVYNDLLERIGKEEFPVDSQLPTENALMDTYHVSITTVRKAVQQLADQGIVAKRQGLGTFVIRVPEGIKKEKPSTEEPQKKPTLKIAVFLPNTMKLLAEGDSRHWALNVRRLNGIYARAVFSNAVIFIHGFGEPVELEQFDGAICLPSYAYDLEADDLRRQLMEKLNAARKPYVTVSEFDPRFASKYWVIELIELEFYKAVMHLLAGNNRKIAMIGPDLDWKNPRYTGYRKALNNEGIAYREDLIVNNPLSDSASAYQACAALFNRFHGKENALANMDAIFCTTDLQAYGVMSYLKDHGIRVPEDVSVMGVDNLPESAAMQVPLTSMEFSGVEIGSSAFDLLLEVLEGKHPDGVTISSPGKIFPRKSVAAKKTAF